MVWTKNEFRPYDRGVKSDTRIHVPFSTAVRMIANYAGVRLREQVKSIAFIKDETTLADNRTLSSVMATQPDALCQRQRTRNP